MKRGLFTVLFALFAMVGFSQVDVNVKTGINFGSWMGENYGDMKFKPGFRVGVGIEYQFTDLLSLQPTLFFSQKGARDKYVAEVGEFEGEAKLKINEWYMDIPVNLQLRFELSDKVNLLAATGPYIGVGIGGKTKEKAESGKITIDEKSDTFGEDNLKRFDAGWGIGLGVEINRFQVGLDTQFGFCQLVRDVDNSPHNVNIGITVGYTF